MFAKVLSFMIGIYMFFMSLFGVDAERPAIRLNAEKVGSRIAASQNARVESGEITGSVVMVNQFSENVFTGVYGTADAEGRVLDENAVFRIASMTKPICAVALLMEYQKGTVDIYADVADYLPQYKDMQIAVTGDNGEVTYKKAENSIKVYQLVSHTSGLQSDSALSVYEDIPGGKTVAAVAEYLATRPLQFEPGTAQSYATEPFDVAARIIEVVSGMEFSEYLKVNLFDKLGMKDTGFEPTEEQWARMVAIHNLKDGKVYDCETAEGTVFGNYPMTYHGAGACLFSTAADYMKFAEMLLNNGKAADGTVILTENSVKLMKTPVVSEKIMSGSQKWGLGVRVITDNSYTLPKGCFGWSGAYGTHFWIDPDNKICVVYMKNSMYDGGAGCKTANELEKDVMNSFSMRLSTDN